MFAGGWTQEAAEAVCAGVPGGPGPAGTDGPEGTELAPAAVLDLLAGLADQSLVVAEEQPDGAPRYRLLETLREYARERLEARGEAAAVRDRHAAHFLALAEAARPHFQGPHQAAWFARLEREHDNLRAALDWLLAAGRAGPALRLGCALYQFWDTRGHWREGRAWLARALALPAAAPRRRAPPGRRPSTRRAGWRTARASVPPPAPSWRRPARLAEAVGNFGQVARRRGDLPEARALYEESLAVDRALGNARDVANALGNLAAVAAEQGDYGGARALQAEHLRLAQELGSPHGVAWALEGFAQLAARSGAPERRCGWRARRRPCGRPPGRGRRPARRRRAVRARLAPARRALGEAGPRPASPRGGGCRSTKRSRRRGGGRTPWPPAPAGGAGQPGGGGRPPAPAPRRADGARGGGAAPGGGGPDRPAGGPALVVTEATVGRHLVNIYAKLGVSSRAAATAFALRQGLA